MLAGVNRGVIEIVPKIHFLVQTRMELKSPTILIRPSRKASLLAMIVHQIAEGDYGTDARMKSRSGK